MGWVSYHWRRPSHLRRERRSTPPAALPHIGSVAMAAEKGFGCTAARMLCSWCPSAGQVLLPDLSPSFSLMEPWVSETWGKGDFSTSRVPCWLFPVRGKPPRPGLQVWNYHQWLPLGLLL